MGTMHCIKCSKEKSCGGNHLYVIEFRKEVENSFLFKSKKGYLYVGSTSKSVDDRLKDNYLKKENGDWKYNSKNSKRIRKYFSKFRPDLFYSDLNPIIRQKNKKNYVVLEEAKLADRLREMGYRVGGPTLIKKKKKVKNDKR